MFLGFLFLGPLGVRDPIELENCLTCKILASDVGSVNPGTGQPAQHLIQIDLTRDTPLASDNRLKILVFLWPRKTRKFAIS